MAATASSDTESEYGMPSTVCYVCHYQLQRFHMFSEMARKSNRFLQDLLINGTEVTQNALNMQPLSVILNLTLTPTVHLSISNLTNASSTLVLVKDEQTLENSEEKRGLYTLVHEEIDIEEFKVEFLTDDINETDKVNKASLNAVEHWSTSYCTYAASTNEAVKDEEILENLTLTPTVHLSVKDEQTLENSEEERGLDTLVHEEIDVKEFKVEFLTDDINETDKVNKASLNAVEHWSTSNCTYASSTNEAVRDEEILENLTLSVKDEQTLENSEEERGLDTLVHEEIDVKEFKVEFLTDDKNETDKVNKASLNAVEHSSTSNCTYAASTNVAVKDEEILENIKEEDTEFEESEIESDRKVEVNDDSNKTDSVRKSNSDIKTDNKTHLCSICNEIFYKKRKLVVHLKTHIGVKAFFCHRCDKTFDIKSNLTRHMLIHTGEKQYSCNGCDKIFCSRGSLTRHMRIHTGEKPYSCNRCDKRFCEKSHLSTHMRIHTGEKPYSCNVCDKRFCKRSALTRHMQIHTGEKPYSCNRCDKRFFEKSNLSTHMRIHTGEKPYSCNVCDKRFSVRSALTRHMQIHTGEKPYSCNRCDKRFFEKSNLSTHMRIHTGEKPYSCNVCDKRFCVRSALTKHTLIHTGEKPYSCNRCDKRFREISALTKHTLIHTGEKPYSCNRCDKIFTRKYSLTKHVLIHN